MRHRLTALALLLLGVGKLMAWHAAPDAYKADAWNIGGAAFAAALLFVLGLVHGSLVMWLAVALLAAFELSTIGCNAAYMINPWPVAPGDELCTARVDLPLELAACLMTLALVVHIVRAKK